MPASLMLLIPSVTLSFLKTEHYGKVQSNERSHDQQRYAARTAILQCSEQDFKRDNFLSRSPCQEWNRLWLFHFSVYQTF